MNQLLGHAPLFLRMKHWIVTEAFALLRHPQIWIYFLWKGEAVCQWRALITEARQEKTCSKVSRFISGWKVFNAQRRNWALNTFSETTSLNKLHQFVRISFFLFLIILLYKPLRFITGHVIIVVFPVCEALYFVFVLSVLLKNKSFLNSNLIFYMNISYMYDLMPYYYYWLVFYNKQNQKEQFAGWKRSCKGSVIFLFFLFSSFGSFIHLP